MRAVVLDGYTTNPGDLSWSGIEKICSLTVYDRTAYDVSDDESEARIIQRIADADIVFTNKTPLSARIIAAAPRLVYIGVLATGYNVVDLGAAKERNIVVTNVPAYSTASVAQMTVALLLELCHHVGDHDATVHRGLWSQSPDFCFWNHPLVELAGKTFGIVGYGRIGRAVAAIVRAMGMEVLVYSRGRTGFSETGDSLFVDLPTLFQDSDVISLHCPLTEETRGMINRETIGTMKDGVWILNTSRGALINEEDLARALESGKVAHAAVDVVSQEPILANNPLLGAKNCIITPHIAWAPLEARRRLLAIAEGNLRSFLAGDPINRVN